MAKLKPRARIIRTIGDQLISGPEAAIIELVKNSYDAEATFAEVKFRYSVAEGFSIIVKDDGHGMTYDDLVNNWLEPATDVKTNKEWSKNNVRRLLGAKGIGRFAVSRLGEISLVTSSAKSPSAGKIETSSIYVDWSLFSADKYLEDVELDIVRDIESDVVATGVEIEISQLRDNWSKKQLERLILELRRISHPRGEDRFSIYLDIECFNSSNSSFEGRSVFIAQNDSIDALVDGAQLEKNLIQPFVFSEVSDYRLEGVFADDGSFRGVFRIQRGDNVEQNIETPALPVSDDESSCGPVNIKLNVFDREVDAIESLFGRMNLNFSSVGIRKARKILTDISGISILRNNFRIRPYGDPDYDWLSLQAKRVQDPSKHLGSDQVSGYVEITGELQSGIVERSSREGLEVNGSFRRLKSLISNLLPHIEERRFDFREKAGIGRRPATNVQKARDASKLKQVTKALEKIPEEYRAKLITAIEKDATTINVVLDEVDAYQKILQSRAALGLVVAEVIHEGRRRLDPMLTSIKTLKADYKYAFSEDRVGQLYRENFPAEIETLLSCGTGLGRLFKRLDPISGRRRGRPASFKLSDVLSDTLSIMSHTLESNSIAVECEVSLNSKCYGYREDLHAVLLNIIENASYWLSTTNDRKRIISIGAQKKDCRLYLTVANNGPEIDEAYRSRLFDAGFSLKSDGTGLGLAIAREACRASKGDLMLDESVVDTSFIIEFPLEGEGI
ncbi:ATP-binding protein [Saccharophagus degradans]|uniref:sensor histidine kinase n=1 Tax=Saccharophagus degradans TaxID=86304 RepID=UPI001C086ADB|nr:sensor histidine kinase [Saccharophagus degradans]MBU2984995.1 ATP-binding protein [Saccharophagus degradans]